MENLCDVALSIRLPGCPRWLCYHNRYSFIGTLLKLEGKYSEEINDKYPNRTAINKLLISCGYDVGQVWKIEKAFEESSLMRGYDQFGIYDESIALSWEFRMQFYDRVRRMYGVKRPSLFELLKRTIKWKSADTK